MDHRRETVLRPFEENAGWMNTRIQKDIEQYRKGNARLTVTDANGHPVQAHITVRQKTHDFQYGANLFGLDELETPEKNAMYRQRFAEIFNMATLPFYWRDLEPVPGKPRYEKDSYKIYRRPAPDLCLEYCEANGITPKAHCLNYNSFTPNWVPNDVPETKRLLEKRFRELAERYAHRIPGWEVTNETFWESLNDRKFYREKDYISWSFATAEKYFPQNELIINEAHCNVWMPFQGRRSPYYAQIERELEKGTRIDTIGMQYHMFIPAEQEGTETVKFYDPNRIFSVLDTYADFGKPMQITELTIPCYSAEAEDEEIQAEIIRNIYRMWFSHPNMESIIYWNLIDGYAYNAVPGDMKAGENYYYGGLLRFDGSPKPAFKMIQHLFREEWHTETETHTDASGTAVFRGFYGNYELTVTAGGKTVTLPYHLDKKASESSVITLPW